MIKPKIISDLEMQELAKGISRAEADHKIAQAQNDYCYKETLRQVIAYLGNDRGWGLVKKVKALQGLEG